MSFARKGSPKRGRIVMAGTNQTNRQEINRPLTQRVALVTGGSRGIGRTIALRLASLGASVAICWRDSEALQATSAELAHVTERMLAQTADVTRSGGVADPVPQTGAKLGRIAILVNNAGIGLFGPAHEKSEADWERVVNTN